MKNLAIITARMTSSRLPGKVMKKIQDTPMIKILYDRLRKSNLIDQIVVATTNCKSDDILVQYLKKKKLNFTEDQKKMLLKE